MLNDTPVACQIREPTDPQGDRWHGEAVTDEVLPPSPPAATGTISRPSASASFVSDGPISSNSGRNGGKNAGRNYVSALPQRAVPGRGSPHLLAGIASCHRCRTKGLRVRSPARRLPRPLAPATVGVFLSYRRTSQAFPSSGAPPIAFPLGGAVLNGAPPKAFPLGGRWRAAPDEVFSPADGTPDILAASAATCQSRPRGGFGAI